MVDEDESFDFDVYDENESLDVSADVHVSFDSDLSADEYESLVVLVDVQKSFDFDVSADVNKSLDSDISVDNHESLVVSLDVRLDVSLDVSVDEDESLEVDVPVRSSSCDFTAASTPDHRSRLTRSTSVRSRRPYDITPKFGRRQRNNLSKDCILWEFSSTDYIEILCSRNSVHVD